MTLEEAAANIGNTVIYRPTPNQVEQGVITATTHRYVFVRYGTDQHAKATAAAYLELAAVAP
jgi:hypothetical protein